MLRDQHAIDAAAERRDAYLAQLQARNTPAHIKIDMALAVVLCEAVDPDTLNDEELAAEVIACDAYMRE